MILERPSKRSKEKLIFIQLYLIDYMANLTIYQPEILFLRAQILTRYCDTFGYEFDSYCQRLTGTLKHYEHICEVMQEEINQHEKLVRYLALIQNKALQNSLKKQIGATETEQKLFLRKHINSLSGSVLRKLIFEGQNETSQGYKDSFIQICYLYIEKERSEFLVNDFQIEKQDGTIPPFGYAPKPLSNGTVPVFQKASSFSLTPLKSTEDSIAEGKSALVFKGNKIQLNRGNLDKTNATITSKIQAEIRLENGEWVLVNESQLRTTFIQVNGPIKIKKGDIVVFGNQRFLFED